MANNKKLVFVYNANSGKTNAVLDYGKKYLNPSEYDCQLCMVSYGPLGMKKDWNKFVQNLPLPTEFLHKDEFEQKHPKLDITYPSLVLMQKDSHEVIMNDKDFDKVKTLDDLKQLTLKSIKNS